MLNNSGPRYKRSKLEKDVNKDVLACVGILLLFCTVGGIGEPFLVSMFLCSQVLPYDLYVRVSLMDL